jgi:ABC-type antimicrobial peptide transport system permease subunit
VPQPRPGPFFLVSSITTVDLRGISRIEEMFVLVLAAATMALHVGVAFAERRQELATMSALGVSLRRAAAFLWSEAALVLAFSLVLAAILGWLLAEMLVAMLRHVFDPPPDTSPCPGHTSPSWAAPRSWAGSSLQGWLPSRFAACRSAPSCASGSSELNVW